MLARIVPYDDRNVFESSKDIEAWMLYFLCTGQYIVRVIISRKLTVNNRCFYRESLPEVQRWAYVFDMP